jgi:aminopeptidase N
MRKWFIVVGFILIVHFVWAQPGPENRSVVGPDRIAALEEKAHQQSLSRLFDMNTVASSDFEVNFYRCEWEVDPAVQFLKGKVTSYFTITQTTGSIVFDLDRTLTVDSIRFRNGNIAFTQTADNGLRINFGSSLNTGQRDSVSIYYKGAPNPGGLGSFQISTHGGVPILWTLSEPYGAKDWWPCKNANTDKADSIDIVITCPDIYSSSTNGTPVLETVNSGKKTTYWKHRYPIASYLVGMAVTNYKIAIDSCVIGTTSLPLKMYSYPEYGDYNLPIYIAKQCLPTFSSLFGDYPFIKESYSQTLFEVGGGIEHQTNSLLYRNDWNQTCVAPCRTRPAMDGDKVTLRRIGQDIW